MNKRRVFIAARWLAATAVAVWTARQFYLVGHAPEAAAVYGALHGLYGLAGLLTAVMLISPELVDWGSTPLNRMFDAVLMPNESAPPPLDYTLARFYRQQMRYEEACEEYLKIIRYHPRELPAYIEGMITAGQAQRTDLAARLFRLGRGVFRESEIRERLQLALDDSRLIAAAAAEAVANAAEEEEEEPAEPVEELLPELTEGEPSTLPPPDSPDKPPEP